LMISPAKPRWPMPPETPPDYVLGYGKPPLHTRFQKGRSGNPKGRPRGKKNMSTLLSAALDASIIVVENGRRKKITKREAIVTQLVNKSASADLYRHEGKGGHRTVCGPILPGARTSGAIEIAVDD